jgi:RND family efflux transporter MFP subunit
LQIAQYQTAEKTAQARVQSARAQLAALRLRLKFTQVTASDDGVISSRTATLGAVVPQGQELFRLIRRNRLEWRAEVTTSELGRLKVGQPATVTVEGAGRVAGTVRVLGPTVDAQTRNALVYVDLPDAAGQGLRPGMFARGEFVLGDSAALTLPQESIALRDGFAYVFRVGTLEEERARVSRVKVQTGRRVGNRVEIVSGLSAADAVVAAGAAFLADGDTVRVVPR